MNISNKQIIFLLSLLSFITILLLGVKQVSALNSLKQIEIITFKPSPNYRLCTDPRDIEDLTDGILVRYPIWIRPQCVGWREQGLVRIKVKVLKGRTINGFSGTISLHTARGTHAGVDVPSRIDVYGELGGGRYHYAGGISINNKEFNDRESNWLHIKVLSHSSNMLIIVRPRGKYFFLDEIKWQAEKTELSKNLKVIGNQLDCKKDSIERHRQSLLSALSVSANMREKWKRTLGRPRISTWVVKNPFAPLQMLPTEDQIINPNIKVDLVGTQSEIESGCIGIFTADENERQFSVSVHGDPMVTRWVKISEIQSILAANGKIAYDPLLPLGNKPKITVAGFQASYLWFQADFRKIPPGLHKVIVKINNTVLSWTGSITITITVVPIKLQSNKRPAAINWAYTSDRPIWRDREIILTDLVQHGINVFVLHPSSIPKPSLNNERSLKAEQRLIDDLTLYHGKGLVLLYLKWGQGRGPTWLNPLSGKSIEKQKETVQRWVKRILAIMESLNIDYSEWALYPIDEPHGDNLRFLREVAEWIKEVDPHIQTYANPISTKSSPTQPADLIPLEKLVDIWQPSLRFAQNDGRKFFTKLKRPWWVFAGAPRPVKAASPWEHYRLMPWRAWQEGAAGVGFWSYSDTSGTSAWDDLDGRRPDYAIVYEGRDGDSVPVSSRRWEAFREGVEDFRLLESAIKGEIVSNVSLSHGLRKSVSKILSQPSPSYERVETLRRKLLGLQ